MMRGLLAGAVLACAAFPMGAAWQASRADQPRLVGLRCDFTSGPIYADTESAFPRCDTIQPNRGAR